METKFFEIILDNDKKMENLSTEWQVLICSDLEIICYSVI
jgi:hypothetical protein